MPGALRERSSRGADCPAAARPHRRATNGLPAAPRYRDEFRAEPSRERQLWQCVRRRSWIFFGVSLLPLSMPCGTSFKTAQARCASPPATARRADW